MTTPDMPFLAAFIKREAGIILPLEKVYLVESRLASVAAHHGKDSVAALVDMLKLMPGAQLRRDVAEALTTNETSFFRDGTPFEMLRNHVLPRLIQERAATRRLRIWCAAASTGQEPYSLAMMLAEERAKLAGWTIEILATDLDTAVLAKAKAATYSKFEIQRGLPVTMLVRHFVQSGPDAWQVKPEIRNMVTFKQLNLLDGRAGAGTFDVVFCRNVLIYFDLPTKAQVLERIGQQMACDGVLFLGGAETVMGITESFAASPGLRGTYVKRRQLSAAA